MVRAGADGWNGSDPLRPVGELIARSGRHSCHRTGRYPVLASAPPSEGLTRSRSTARVPNATNERGGSMSPATSTPDTIVLIHGFWVTPRSWEHWIEHYEAKGLPRHRSRLPRVRGRSRSTRRGPDPDREGDGPPHHRAPRRHRRRARNASDPHRPLRRRRVHTDPARPRLRRGRRHDQLGADRGSEAHPAVADPRQLPGAEEPREPPQGRRPDVRAVEVRVHEHPRRNESGGCTSATTSPRRERSSGAARSRTSTPATTRPG